MKKLGISSLYSYNLRFGGGLLIAWMTFQMPSSWFSATVTSKTFVQKHYGSFNDLITTSLSSALLLTVKIIILISVLIFFMDWIKSRSFVKDSVANISKGFAMTVGIILGITYGAGVLIKEKQSGALSRHDIFYIGTFLMICHAIIEDTLLFVIFGADLTLVIGVRVLMALVISWLFLILYRAKEGESHANDTL